jgi:Putative restriction endonuclease
LVLKQSDRKRNRPSQHKRHPQTPSLCPLHSTQESLNSAEILSAIILSGWSRNHLLESGYPIQPTGDAMLEENMLLSLPTEEDLLDRDEKPVDNELQLLAPMLLRGILSYIWDDRLDWFFGINLSVYPVIDQPAIGPDAFLSLGVERVRENNKLRLSYLVYREGVMPQWVLELVSKQPSGEYDEKFRQYAELGVLYYTIYNPSHYRRDKHEAFEVYRLEQGRYVRQLENPIWMPEIGLGIGHEVGSQDRNRRDWLYWYDEQGSRYPVPENALKEEKLLREREQLMRQQAEERLAEEVRSRLVLADELALERGRFLEIAEQLQQERGLREVLEEQLEQERIQREIEVGAQQALRLEAELALTQEKQTIALNLLKQGIEMETIAQATGLTIAQLTQLSR